MFVAQAALVAACPPRAALADERSGGTALTLVEAVNRPDLAKATCVVISSDDKFLYASCWDPGALVVFARDQKNGKLTHVQTIEDQPQLRGATTIALSSDSRLAVVPAFRSKKATLFRRDAEKGKLTELDIASGQERDMDFPCGASFSPDGKFVAIADAGGREDGGAVHVFRVEGEKLVAAGSDLGRDGCYASARTVVFHPDGKTLFVACCRPGSLVVADFDSGTGATKVRQILWAKDGGHDYSQPEVGNVLGVQGVMHLATSEDGKFVTTCSGRFGGDTCVTSFKFGDKGHLSFVQCVKSSGKNFAGGNQVALSPDGASAYATGTLTGVVACAGSRSQDGIAHPTRNGS